MALADASGLELRQRRADGGTYVKARLGTLLDWTVAFWIFASSVVITEPSPYELSFFLGEMFFNDGDLDRAKIYLERTLEVQADHFRNAGRALATLDLDRHPIVGAQAVGWHFLGFRNADAAAQF